MAIEHKFDDEEARRFRVKAKLEELEKCVWYKNQSIEEDNEWYERCMHTCDGYNIDCLYYHTIHRSNGGKDEQ